MNPASPSLLNLALPLDLGETSSPILALTSGLARGDDLAWAEFHRAYGPAIFRQLLAATRGDHDLASEALQQTYLRVARHARPCDCAPEFAGWLRVVARTALSDCRRRQQRFFGLLRRREADPSEASAANESGAEEQRLQAAVDAALGSLSPDERALLEAKYFSGADVRSIAARLEISPKAVESRLTRARAALRAQLLSALARHE